MSSTAYNTTLKPLLNDAHELNEAHLLLRHGDARTWKDGAHNRAVVVMCTSAWEAFLEELVLEAVEALTPEDPTHTTWQSLKVTARGRTQQFNNPTVPNVNRLFSETLGLKQLSKHWFWRGTDCAKAENRLTYALDLRHKVAHGAVPRPKVSNYDAMQLPLFFMRLGRSTDATVRGYLHKELHVSHPWAEGDA